jgi:hypothetical protein
VQTDLNTSLPPPVADEGKRGVVIAKANPKAERSKSCFSHQMRSHA